MLTSHAMPHAVVIGAGLGGLAAAMRLGARGYRVTVLDRLPQPGGRATVHRQDGFTFDAGPTIVTAPFVMEELWRFAGQDFHRDVTLKALDPFYVIRFDDGDTFTCRSDAEAMKREVGRISPGDVAGYERFMAESEEIYRIGFEQLGHVPFDSVADMVKLLPSLVGLKAWRSVHGHVAHHVKHPKLRMGLSFHPLFVGGNPFRTTCVYSLIAYLERRHGVHWAVGGTHSIVKAMVKVIVRQGGAVLSGTKAVEITQDNGRATGVRLASGQVLPASIVVSNADAAHTYRTLIAGGARRRWTPRKMAKARHSMSLFVWYFGTKRRYDAVPHHSILMGPRYHGLIRDIFDRKILAEDMSLYLHRPSASDPSVAPAGCDAFYVLSPVPNQDSGIDWRDRAESYRSRIARRLHETVLPGFEAEIISQRLMTPDDFEQGLLSYKGAAFGLEPVLTQSAWFRPHNKSEELENLFLVGAGTHPGAGIPGVISSARVLDLAVPPAERFARAAP
ncbi:MAG: phytoene desaturase [Rhizobiales bacterium]|nr:phytoene desaturase [Hyphomicrobiales bacterium]